MSDFVRKNNQSMDELKEARELRHRAELLEQKARVRARLRQLMELSKDSYYDRYLAQMMKDLENGRATPEQVEREAQRSYNKYREHMAKVEREKMAVSVPPKSAAQTVPAIKQNVPQLPDSIVVPETVWQEAQEGKPVSEEANTIQSKDDHQKRNIEYKVGVHIFSMIGAVFVLVAFVIFGFYFLSGRIQGLCLYGAALALVVISELIWLRQRRREMQDKRSYRFLHVITGIGIGGLYAANLVNYLALHTISGLAAMIITLIVAAGALLISRKKDSAAIRLISLMGCYICFLPIQGIKTDLDFLIVSAVISFINVGSILIEGRKEQSGADVLHLVLNLFFTFILMGAAFHAGISGICRALYIITAFLFVDLLSLKKCVEGNELLFTLSCIVNGIYVFCLFLLGNFAPEVKEQPAMALFVHLTVEILVLSICGVIFLLWQKDNGRRWAQLYYGVGTVLLLGSFSEYPLEILLSLFLLLLFTKISAGQKEVIVLDCIVVFWIGFKGFLLAESWQYWYCWLLAGALVLSAVRIKYLYLYHEIVITVSILLTCWSQCYLYFYKEYGLDRGWLYPISAGILLLLFLYFNHLPGLKDKNQQVYNRINLVFMLLYYLGVWFCQSYVISSIMMVMGAVTIVIVFRKRYTMELQEKYLVLAGFLTYFTLTGHYRSPVIVSIFLMVISLFCVGIGFRLSDKKERICGLVMAAFVCLKLVLYDFREVEAVYRVIVFLTVGIMALLISFVYVKLEKRSNGNSPDVAVFLQNKPQENE